jgi:two-component system sensor histidine kinase KdpD
MEPCRPRRYADHEVLDRLSPLLLRAPRPPLGLGIAVAVGSVAAITALLYPLKEIAPAVSLGVVYLLAVLLVSTFWGLALGLVTSVASAAAFNFFHIPPTGRFAIADGENWVALVVFLIAAVAVSTVADLARSRALEAEQRRREADLGAELARLLLGTPDLRPALGPASQRIARALGLPSAAITLEAEREDERRLAFPLMAGERRVGTLLAPRDMPDTTRTTLAERLVPALEALLAAALDREALTREVVETSALRRSDEIKTAVLRAVSHDLRSPLTAILAAGDALASATLDEEDRRELAAGIRSEGGRLSRLVDKLLDLSRLEAGAAEPRRDWTSVDEIIRAAAEHTGAGPDRLKLTIDADLPLIEGDPAQLERAVANLLENALRHGEGHPVSVRARASGGRILVRVVDRGPGIPIPEQDRIFEPFYRAPGGHDSGPGSGLGLAIVRGFVEANGGWVRVESLPGQGASFVIGLPIPRSERADGDPAAAAAAEGARAGAAVAAAAAEAARDDRPPTT